MQNFGLVYLNFLQCFVLLETDVAVFSVSHIACRVTEIHEFYLAFTAYFEKTLYMSCNDCEHNYVILDCAKLLLGLLFILCSMYWKSRWLSVVRSIYC